MKVVRGCSLVRYTNFLTILFIGAAISGSAVFAQPKTYYVAKNGNDSNTGLDTSSALATVSKALSKISAGDTIYVRGGTYTATSQLTISSSGIDTLHRNCLMAYPGESVLFDYSSMGTPHVSGSADGIRLTGRYWYIRRIDVKGAQHNGIAINGGWYNLIEFCAIYENRNAGLQISNLGSFNKIINCDSYFNRDSSSASSYDGNADGFAPKLDNGTHNYFYGCRSWQNSDDGWDGYVRPAAPVAGKDTMLTILENCWCFANGYLKNGLPGTGNGNGFKMGGGDKVGSASNGDSLRHHMILIRCLSFGNLVKGFDQNNNRGTMTLINCTGFANGTYNFSVPGFVRSGETLTIKNCISLASNGVTLSGVPNPVLATNSWLAPFSGAVNSDFITIDTTGVRGPRKPDGSLPDVSFMHLVQGGRFIDAGTEVGLPFYGNAVDLGAFESNFTTGVIAHSAGRVSGFVLQQNYPNPFNPSTNLSFTVGSSGSASLRIYNVLGQEVAAPFTGQAEAGKTYTVRFDAGMLPSGVYFARLEGSATARMVKMLLMK